MTWRVTYAGEGGLFQDPHEPALMTVLNYSGGKQSTALLWMILREEIPRPESFLVLNADPGMENSATYDHVEAMRERCAVAGLAFETVEGPNLYRDLVTLRARKASRTATPPYWTKDPKTGKRGRLNQQCTEYYKIRPMDRAMRRALEERTGINRKSGKLPVGCVEKWLGFTYDEVSRVKPPPQQYVRFAYPLIDLGMTRAATEAYFAERGLELPPRSVCNACFANGPRTLKDMHDNRPEDWAQAVEVDEAIRDWTQIGIRRPVYVSDRLKPLQQLADEGFGLGDDADGWSCDSGYCFT